MPCARGMRGCGQVPWRTVSGENPISRTVMFGGEAQPLSCLGAAASLLTITTGFRDTARYACRIGPDWACPASERDFAMLYHVLCRAMRHPAMAAITPGRSSHHDTSGRTS